MIISSEENIEKGAFGKRYSSMGKRKAGRIILYIVPETVKIVLKIILSL